jgi:hypothetical protein
LSTKYGDYQLEGKREDVLNIQLKHLKKDRSPGELMATINVVHSS